MRQTLSIAALILFFSLLACSKEKAAQLAVPDIPVYVTKETKIPIYNEFVGQIYGFKDIAIRARVEGFLEGIHFEEGLKVKKGDLLYTVESQPFEADVAAKLSKVAEAKTMLAKAQSDLNRIKPLAKQKAVSQSDLDSANAQYDASISVVEAAEANLRASKIQLSYTKIHSPISGFIGKTKAKVGDFVGRSPNPVILNVVSRIDMILVQSFLTENQYMELYREYVIQKDTDKVELEKQETDRVEPEKQETDSVRHGEKAKLELILADGSLYKHTGKFDFIDREVDPTTGTILFQASFPNPSEILRPGQFAKIKAKFQVIEKGIMVPQRCVSELQGLHRVYVVTDENKVEMREIKVGPKISNFWVIEEGVKAGEKVVYEGLQKVKNDVSVNPVIQDIKPVKL